MAELEDGWTLTSAARPASGLCAACPGPESCYLVTSVHHRAAYVKGCRSELARKAQREAQREFQANKRAKLAGIETDPDPDEALWTGEKPYDSQEKYSSYRPGAYCSVCGSEAERLSARGTAVVCESCGTTVEETTQSRIDAVVDRYSAPGRRGPEKLPELTPEEQLDIAGNLGMACDAIDNTIDRLTPDFDIDPQLADGITNDHDLLQRASAMIHRLRLIRGELSSVVRNPTNESVEKALRFVEVLGGEWPKATAIIGQLDKVARYLSQQGQPAKPVVSEQPRLAIAARPEPATQPYYTGPLYREPEPEPEPEYWPGEQLDGGPYYCQIAGHIGYIKATAVLYLGNSPEPGRKSWAERLVFVCGKHADIDRLMRVTQWPYCYNIEDLDDY